MSKKFRYIILATGFITFVILAPATLLYVKGVGFNFRTKTFQQTGLLAIRTDPDKVNIFVNEELSRKSSGDINFLKAGEYAVSIQKPGYFTWSKRLQILPNLVTWANPSPNKLYLFSENPNPETINNNITDFNFSKNTLTALSQSVLSVTELGSLNSTYNYPFSKPVSRLKVSPGIKYAILYSDTAEKMSNSVLVFKYNDHSFTDISSLFTESPILEFSSNDNLFALNKSILYSVNITDKTKNAVAQNIQAFATLDKDIYYIKKTAAGNALYILPDGGKEQTLASAMPNFKNGNLFVTSQKQIFLLADGALYKINQEPQLLASGITDYNFNSAANTLIFVHNGELSNYNFSSQQVDLITRSNESLINPILQQYTSMAFVSQGNKATAMELDSRDRQNEYIFYSGKNIKKIMLSDQAQYMFVLDGTDLKMLKTR